MGFYLVQLTMRQAATQNPFIFPGQSQHWSTKFRIDKSRHIRCLKIGREWLQRTCDRENALNFMRRSPALTSLRQARPMRICDHKGEKKRMAMVFDLAVRLILHHVFHFL